MTTRPQDVTGLLRAWTAGDPAALERLIPAVLPELRRIAARCMAQERPGHTLQVSALVNEAYLRLVGVEGVDWRDRSHFFSMSARLMRRLLVDHARAKQYQKRGGAAVRVALHDDLVGHDPWDLDLVALNDALDELSRIDPRRGNVVELRFFGGLTVDETASVLQVSDKTVMRDWDLARAWLRRALDV